MHKRFQYDKLINFNKISILQCDIATAVNSHENYEPPGRCTINANARKRAIEAIDLWIVHNAGIRTNDAGVARESSSPLRVS